MALRAGVVGASGFAGIELVRLLAGHPDFEIACLTSDAQAGQRLAEVHPSFEGSSAASLLFERTDEADLSSCDLVFLAVPHTAALALAPRLLAAKVTVVDLSADFRLRDASVYEQWYGVAHTAPDELKEAVFGLPELFPDDLARAASRIQGGHAALIACAGCYPTATSLAAAPALRAGLVAEASTVVADALSGVTGAGKKATQRTHFCHANENAEAYGVCRHRHTPEIEQILGIEGRLAFTPHLVPLNRGLLSTVYLSCDPAVQSSAEELVALYASFYADSAFVSVLSCGMPRTASVAGTNRAQVGVAIEERTHTIIAVCAIDNLGKGAAGQAIQCANIAFGLDERRGLEQLACAV